MSIHLNAEKGQIAETVLLPGDPLRARHIAETFLENPVQHNTVRGMLGFTGTYKGERVSVQGTGMGIPSCMIYVNELIQDYGCKNLIRVGTAGSYQEGVHVRDLVLAQAACTDSNINRVRFGERTFAPIADFELLLRAYQIAQERGFSAHVGNIMSSDTFYNDNPTEFQRWAEFGVLAVEMEAAGLYTLAAKYGVRALTILTISDHLVTHEVTSAEERQLTFNGMIEVALDAALGLEKKA
ncbi:purine-nucleoside phosphorylase [Deinococcus radiodurans]|jgi:purine-nucleoside phosphorylase (EC 2.4.2.1)|nr:purine-nucleoside phosphorylase [Deinococcus radiodurans]ANC70772.1 purine nucleoside phosphorylase DeoD-type [Deinococcus radiodurans R1 = ATCC 13939 = DSM 20539]QIP27870.1 purine-nucleoside phosphorylase [Deinococcus radiodurans]QIP31250.1 purine-nucleoside phosphorylase [Deinococcus radiodurans]UID71128.1 purine nucleoside phosphorylase DeoD-type [Deinococcus radiodurans R1 = ATCC 13939 = DSM 20539]